MVLLFYYGDRLSKLRAVLSRAMTAEEVLKIVQTYQLDQEADITSGSVSDSYNSSPMYGFIYMFLL